MTEQEILTRQETSGNREFFLILIGRFYHAYGCGAFALARLTGYQVRRIQRKQGDVLMLGFPIDRFDSVLNKVRDAGGEMESVDSKTWMFRGLDGTPDQSMVSEPKPAITVQPASPHLVTESRPNIKETVKASWLEDAVRSFDLSMATPMDAMLFLNSLKQRLQLQPGSGACQWDRDSGFACESLPGHGLAE